VPWHFVPWTLQYLISGSIALIISLYILYKNPKSLPTQSFFLFGFCAVIWNFLVFLSRNAPTGELSGKLLTLGVSFLVLIQPFLLCTLLLLWKVRKKYFVVLSPTFIIMAFIIFISKPEITWTDYGWAYAVTSIVSQIFFWSFVFAYGVAIIVVGSRITRKAPLIFKKKIKLIIAGFLAYLFLLTVTNVLMSINPTSPPFGGLLIFLEFLVIAYAVSLPVGKIEALQIRNLKKFSKDYLRFLNKLLEVGPGKELGENVVKFKYHLPTLGLSDVVEFERKKISFRPEEPKLNLGEVTDKSLDFMKQRGWTLSAVKPFTDVFVDTYEAMKSKSKKEADEWFERMLRKHGAFLHRHGILEAMPEGARIPGIFRELEVGKSYLVQEDRPRRCLEVLKETVNYGFKGLCFTMRYPPQKVRNEYGLEGVDIIWLRLNPKKGVKTLAPDRLDELEKTISEFIAPGGAVVLVDAFDQIKVVNGFEKSMKFLQKIKVAAARSGANILISMRPESVWEEESAAIAKITKPHRSGPTWTSFELL